MLSMVSWGVTLLPEGKIRSLHSVQLCVKYRLVSATLSPYHQWLKIKEAPPLEVKGPLFSCLLIVRLPPGSRTLYWHLETIYITHTNLVPYIFPENSAHSMKSPAPMLFFISSRVVKWYSAKIMKQNNIAISTLPQVPHTAFSRLYHRKEESI